MTRVLLAIPVVALLAAPASAQSLADVAKRAEAQRAKAAAEKKEPAKVITNGDLKPALPVTAVPPTSTTPVAATAGEPKPAPKKDLPEEIDPKKTEGYWKRRATELHAQLTADEKHAKEERDKLERFRHNTGSVGCFICPARNQLESQLIQMDEDQKRLDANVASDRAAIQQFEDDGRRLNILPGWMRPEN